MKNEKKQSSSHGIIAWIDYLKITACILVMINHYYEAFFRFCKVPPDLDAVSADIFGRFPKPFLIGNFWVCVFCVLSGILASKKIAGTFRELVREMILRYLRFLIPLFISNFIVYLIYITAGYANHEIAALYRNTWLDQYFNGISFLEVIKCSISFSAGLNGPLWMLRPLFCGNIAILITNHILEKYKHIFRNRMIPVAVVCAAMLGAGFVRSEMLYAFAVCCGFLMSEITPAKHNDLVSVLMILAVAIGNYIPGIGQLLTVRSLSLQNVLFSIIFVFAFYNRRSSEKERAHRFPFGAVSFWVYLLHWPIVCSFSCYMITRYGSFTAGYWTVLAETLALVCIMAYATVKSFDKLSRYIIKAVGRIIDKILCIRAESRE